MGNKSTINSLIGKFPKEIHIFADVKYDNLIHDKRLVKKMFILSGLSDRNVPIFPFSNSRTECLKLVNDCVNRDKYIYSSVRLMNYFMEGKDIKIKSFLAPHPIVSLISKDIEDVMKANARLDQIINMSAGIDHNNEIACYKYSNFREYRFELVNVRIGSYRIEAPRLLHIRNLNCGNFEHEKKEEEYALQSLEGIRGFKTENYIAILGDDGWYYIFPEFMKKIFV